MSDTATAPAPADNAAPATPPTEAPAPGNWRDTLPAEIRDAPSLTKFQDPAALAKSYMEAEALIGRKGVIVPGEKDGPEMMAKFRAALGVPDNPEDYKLTAPEGVPADVWRPETAAGFQARAHELGLTPAQAAGLAEWYAKGAAAEYQRVADGIEPDGRKMEDVLREEWGQQHGRKVTLAQRAMAQFGDEAAVSALEAKVGGAALLRMMAKVGEALAEDVPAGMGSGRPAPRDPAAERKSLMVAGGPYWDKLHPEHRATMGRVKELFAMEARR